MKTDSKNKKISFVLYSPFPNYSGGRETWLYNIIKGLVKLDYKVIIYTFKDDTNKQFFDISDIQNITVKKMLTLESLKLLKVISRSYLRIINLILFNIQVFFRALFSDEDNFISLGPITESLPICLLKRFKPNIQYVCSVRGLHAMMLTQTFPALKRIWYYLEKYSLKKADIIMCNGYDTQDYVRNMGLESKVMPNGVDYQYFKHSVVNKEDSIELMSEDETFYIVSTATIQDIKGIPDLIKAMIELKKTPSFNYKVIWVGKGDPSKYKYELLNNDLQTKLIFTGERKNTAEFLKKADIVLCLSGGGGMSMALLEAMAAGCIIIAWDTPIYRQLLRNGFSGILVEENNYLELSDSIKYVKKNKKELLSLGYEAQKKSEQFDWSKLVKRFLSILEGGDVND